MEEVKKILDQKVHSKSCRKTILIVEDEKGFCDIMAQVFLREGFQVFVESNIQGAHKKLSILDFTNTKVDLAVIDTKATENRSPSVYMGLLQERFPNMKSIIVTKDSEELKKISEKVDSAVLDKSEDNANLCGNELCEKIDYSQTAIRKHFIKLRTIQRHERYKKTMKQDFPRPKIVKVLPKDKENPFPFHIAADFKQYLHRRAAKTILDTLDCKDKKLKKNKWIEFKIMCFAANLFLTTRMLRSIISKHKRRHYRKQVA